MLHMTMTPDNRRVKLNLQYRVERDVFEKYKSICDSMNTKFDAEHQTQVSNLSTLPELMEALVAAGFKCTLEQSVLEKLHNMVKQIEEDSVDVNKRLEKMEKKLAKEGKLLYAYQRVGIKWMAPRRRLLLADEMGLGKTIQALMALPEKSPVIVICPNVAKYIWWNECKKWRHDIQPFIFQGRGSFMWPKPGQMFIYNYDILPGSPPDNCPKNASIIFDEAHCVKNVKAKRTKFGRQLADVVLDNHGRGMLLTGSPMLNRPPELWSVLETLKLGDEAYGNWRNFLRLFHGTPSKFGFDWGIPEPEAAVMLKKICLQRKRADVLPDLPTKQYSQLDIDLNNAELQKRLDEIIEDLDEAGLELNNVSLEQLQQQQVIFEALSKIRADLAKAKIPAMLEFIEQYEDNDEPLVVFSAHRAPIDALEHREGWVTITGDTSPHRRSEIVSEFQEGKYKGIGLTIASGGVGITLTHAAHALFVDLMWTPALNAQAEDRICRIGQERGCMIYSMVCKHAVEQRVHELLMLKKVLITAGVDAAKTTNEDVIDYNMRMDFINSHAEQVEENGNILIRLQNTVAKSNALVVPDEVKQKKATHDASNPLEMWAKNGLIQLSAHDPDHASTVNNVGFNKYDNVFGHDLANKIKRGSGLTDKQWKAAINLCKKYQRQIGPMPAM